MLFAFEDTLSKFPNCLLDSEICIGYDGARKLVSDVPKMSNTICFIDVCADNENTIYNFRKARNSVVSGSNVIIVPIPCSEYIFIKAFIGYSTPESQVALQFGNYKNINKSVFRRTICTTRYEWFCKTVISAYKSCYRKGVFTSNDCLCSSNYKDCIAMDLRSKREIYASNFPIPVSGTVCCDINVVVERAYTEYYDMANNFYKLGIISKVYDIG